MRNNTENHKSPIGPPSGGPGEIAVGEKANDFAKSIHQLIDYCKKYIPLMIVAMNMAIVSSVFSLIGPNKLSEITNLITAGMSTEIDVAAVTKIGVFLSVIYLLSLLFGYGQGFIMTTVSQTVSKNLRTCV